MAARKKKKIIVLGAKGLLGSTVSKHFKDLGNHVIEIDRENYIFCILNLIIIRNIQRSYISYT